MTRKNVLFIKSSDCSLLDVDLATSLKLCYAFFSPAQKKNLMKVLEAYLFRLFFA